MRRTARHVVAVVGVALGVTCFAPAVGATSLSQAYDLARQNDRQWRQAQARLRDVQELLPLARGQLLPQVSLSASKSHIQQEQTTGDRTSPQQSYPSDSQVLSVRQPVFRARQFRAVEQAQAQLEQGVQQLRAEEQQLAVRVVGSYLDALLAQDRRRLMDGQLALVSNRLAAAQAGLRTGQGTRNDVDDARAELDRIRAQSIQIDQAIQVSRRQVELLIGTQPGALDRLDLERFDPLRLQAPALDAAVDAALRDNPQVLAAQQEVRSASSALAQAEANHLPTLDLVAQVGKSTGENTFFASTSTRSASLGLQFSLPLYAGGTISAQARQAAAKLEQATEAFEQVSNKVRIELQTEHNAVMQGRVLIEALKTSVASAQEALKSSRRGQEAGVRSLLDVLRSENLLFQAELDLAQTRYTYLAAWLKLQGLMGALKPDVVARLSALFGSR
jgi:TolC family type I secretion outer membrane protein